tara:strand:+ start:55 stop:702 length:648 start_codon:yes stop_codon:yes gene_type:complete
MNYLKAIGINAAIKGFAIFLAYGFFTTIYIHCRHGLDADLPKSVVATLEGPISIYTFGWLALVGLIGLFISTKVGTKECDFETNKPKCVFFFSLPICEAAIALGVVIGATLWGVAIASHILYLFDSTQVKIFPMFYALGVFMFFITYPVAYFTVALLDSSNKIKKQLDAAGLFYLGLTALVLYIGLPLSDIIIIGIVMSACIIFFYVCQKWVIKP